MVLIDKKSAAISKLLAQATIKLTNQGSFLCSFLASQAISNPRNAISKRKTSVNYTPLPCTFRLHEQRYSSSIRQRKYLKLCKKKSMKHKVHKNDDNGIVNIVAAALTVRAII